MFDHHADLGAALSDGDLVINIYMVGGAVRDALLSLPVTERDWVVVGGKAADLLAKGFKQVGKDFPVFLHPETHEEYALARTERKSAPGYHGFKVETAHSVTLEEDLRRRDLTINAMAFDSSGRLIDPYGGKQDLENRRLRHVSTAFVEDPVRILRVARFCARLSHLGFEVAPETMTLMRTMVKSGEVDALAPDRVWAETARALGEPNPGRYIGTLRACGALKRIFPEIDALFGVPQPKEYHPEIDTGTHVLMALEQAVRLSADPRVRFAVLVHDLGKGLTPPGDWPHHRGHEERGVAIIRELSQRLRVPSSFRDLGILAAEHHTHCHRALELRPGTLLKLLQSLDAIRRPERFEQILLACEADARGRLGFEERAYPQAGLLRAARAAATQVAVAPLRQQGIKGEGLIEAIHQRRLEAVNNARSRFVESRAIVDDEDTNKSSRPLAGEHSEGAG